MSSDSPARDWDRLVDLIDRGATGEEVDAALTRAKFDWCDRDPRAVAEAIALMLRDGRDRPTGLTFETGHGGGLRSWPTLRVFLLDVLMATDPDIALEVAREVLAATDSAEEFAVAMRALVMEKPWRASDQELQSGLDALLARGDWQSDRRAGFAEALDLAREIGTADAFRSLARWVDASPPFKDAGSMALHEFAAEYPELAASQLEELSLFADDPGLRAGLMARADPIDLEQLGVVEGYLGSAEVSLDEKREFLALYPLRSATTGFRLYGGRPSPFSREQVVASDAAATRAAREWLSRDEFAPLESEIEDLLQRLEAWRKAAAVVESP